jgi:transketolase
VLKDCGGEPELILIATGSEVGLAVAAYDKLTAAGRKVRVVSMPSTSVFDQQDAAYKQDVLPLQVGARIAIEASHADYWYKYVGLEGRIIGMTSFGESAPGSGAVRGVWLHRRQRGRHRRRTARRLSESDAVGRVTLFSPAVTPTVDR